jgi:ribosomal protein S18 acetylase RimI-like enzyme
MPIKLVPAENYTIDQLTDAYNQTRVDYMVPMPMNASRLAEYIHLYEVDLSQSLVGLVNDDIIGLGMLALRENQSWITRLGVIANRRAQGIGQALMEGLISNSDAFKIEKNLLEVIVGNVPAHRLFIKLGFKEHSELLILRRAPEQVPTPTTKIYPMDKGDIFYCLNHRKGYQAWTNQTRSLHHAKGIYGFHIYTPSGGHGWIVYQRTLFNLSRIMYETEGGDHEEIMLELLKHLHHQHPDLDTYTENIPLNDHRLPAFKQMGYFEVFRRIEMHRYPVI